MKKRQEEFTFLKSMGEKKKVGLEHLEAWDREWADWVVSDAIEKHLGLQEHYEERGDAEYLLRRGKYKAAKPMFGKLIEDWEAGIELLKADDRKWIERELVSSLSEDYSQLPEFQKREVVEELFSRALRDLYKEVREMRAGLREIENGLEEWGEEKPVAVRFEEIQQQKRALRLKWFKAISLFTCGSGALMRAFGFSLWWILIPVLLSVIAIFRGMIIWAKLNWLGEFGCDFELEEYAKNRSKQV